MDNFDYTIKRLSEATALSFTLPQTEVWGFVIIIRSPTRFLGICEQNLLSKSFADFHSKAAARSEMDILLSTFMDLECLDFIISTLLMGIGSIF